MSFMARTVVLTLAFLVLYVEGMKLTARRIDPPLRRDGSAANIIKDNGDKNLQLFDNRKGPRFATNITVDGTQYTVMIDTGSTDLRVKLNDQQATSYNSTNLPVTLTYGAGSAVKGEIAIGDVKFGNYEVARQAYMAEEDISQDDLAQMGLDGLMGLSFDTKISSPIGAKIKASYGDSANWGQSFLANVFDQNPGLPNFITISLSRSEDQESTADSSFYISEVDSSYASVTSAPRLERFPEDGTRWSILVDEFRINGKVFSLNSAVPGTPSNKAVAVLDTGASGISLPDYLVSEIYASIPGSFMAGQTSRGVPCNGTTLVELTFGGQKFPINPIDLSRVYPIDDEKLICVGNVDSAAGFNTDFDFLLGDSFLRNVYSLLNFGDTDENGEPTSSPYIQLLSQTDAVKSVQDLPSIREKTAPSQYRMSLEDVMKEFQTPQDQSESQSAGASSGASGSAALAQNGEAASSEGNEQYVKIIIGLLSGNVLVGVVLVLIAVAFYIRKGESKSRGYKPLSLKDSEYHAYD